MRQAFIPTAEAATIEEARAMAPWAAEVIEADGGWMAFESADDADTWSKQT
jgi:hypothetical protein